MWNVLYSPGHALGPTSLISVPAHVRLERFLKEITARRETLTRRGPSVKIANRMMVKRRPPGVAGAIPFYCAHEGKRV